MRVKLKITIPDIHYDVHTFSQNLHYAIRCIVWRKQNHGDVLLEDRRRKRHPIFLNVSFMQDR